MQAVGRAGPLHEKRQRVAMREGLGWARVFPVGSAHLPASGLLFGISAFHRNFVHLASFVGRNDPGEGARLLRTRRMRIRVGVASVL